MITTDLTEAKMAIEERLRQAQKVQTYIEPKAKRDPVAAERQRIMAILAGLRKQYIKEMNSIEGQDQEMSMIINAKIVAIEQALDEIERASRRH